MGSKPGLNKSKKTGINTVKPKLDVVFVPCIMPLLLFLDLKVFLIFCVLLVLLYKCVVVDGPGGYSIVIVSGDCCLSAIFNPVSWHGSHNHQSKHGHTQRVTSTCSCDIRGTLGPTHYSPTIPLILHTSSPFLHR